MKDQKQPLSPYYQKLADVLTIFWEYHKARLDAGTIAFGYEDGGRGLQPYNGPAETIHDARQSAEILGWENPMQMDIINPFSRAVLRSLNVSWRDFVSQYPPALREDMASIWQDEVRDIKQRLRIQHGDEVRPFTDDYVENLIADCVQDQHELQSPILFASSIPAGLSTGTYVTTDLLAVMNRFFKPAMPLLVSRTSLRSLAETRAAVGRNFHRGAESYIGIDPTSPTMFDMQTLIEAGYGRAMGCPAGRMPTEETQQFLESAIGHRVEKPMLIDFSRALAGEYDRTIGEWWRGLDDVAREQAIQGMTKECYMLVSGKKLEEIRAKREAERATETAASTEGDIQPAQPEAPVTEIRRRGPRKRK